MKTWQLDFVINLYLVRKFKFMLISKVFMISLESSKRIEKHYNSSITDLISIYPAVDSRSNYLDVCIQNNFKVNLHPQYSEHFHQCKGAYGCSLSHFKLYEKIKDLDSTFYYCILEDDIISNQLLEFLKNRDFNYSNKAIVNLIGGINSSAAYLMTSAGAKMLLTEANNEISLPHDKFLFEFCAKKYPSYFDEKILLETYPVTDLRSKQQRDLI